MSDFIEIETFSGKHLIRKNHIEKISILYEETTYIAMMDGYIFINTLTPYEEIKKQLMETTDA